MGRQWCSRVPSGGAPCVAELFRMDGQIWTLLSELRRMTEPPQRQGHNGRSYIAADGDDGGALSQG